MSGLGRAIADSVLFTLFGGTGEDALSWIDLFHIPTGAYLGSLRLPVHPQVIAVDGNRLYALTQEPYGALRGFELPPWLIDSIANWSRGPRREPSGEESIVR